MSTRTWSGANALFTDPTQWSGNAVPGPGDIATINSGTVNAANLNFVNLTIGVNATAGAAGTLSLDTETLDAASVLTINDANAFGAAPQPVLSLQGVNTNNGTINFVGTTANVQFASGASLVNAGAINLIGASPQVQTSPGATPGAITNNGTISITNPNGVYQSAIVNATIAGSGSINIGASGAVSLRQSVAAGQTVAFTGGVNANSNLEIDSPNAFGATVTNFVSGDSLILASIPYTNFTYTPSGAAGGTLTLFSGSTVEGQVKLAGVYSQSTFTVRANALGNTGLDNVIVSTAVTNSATGQTASTAAGPVFRFFDNKFGTHFFTSDTGERDTVRATRSADLIQETNGFGDVSQASTSAVAVYRFFDTNFGTHFFTANAGERDNVRATRPDLTYESNSTFYEHSAQQTGDVAVYRLFDSKTGTQFLTGDQGEYNGLVTAGSPTYRGDLRSEGVAFYAPTGSFT